MKWALGEMVMARVGGSALATVTLMNAALTTVFSTLAMSISTCASAAAQNPDPRGDVTVGVSGSLGRDGSPDPDSSDPDSSNGREAPIPFRRILYMSGGPARNGDLWDAIQALGIDAVSLHSAAAAEPTAARNLGFYRDQVIGKGNLELRDAAWVPLRDRYFEERDASSLVRPTCLSEVDIRAGLHATTARELSKLVETPPFAVCLGDEPSATRRGEPLDVCVGAACLARFRQFLRHRYRASIKALNLAWQTNYRDWEEVRPWSADRIRERELHGSNDRLPESLTPWSDHLAFRDTLFSGLVGDLSRAVHDGFGWPAGITGMQAPSAYGGYDYAKLMVEPRFFEAYDIGGARALARAFARPGALEVATLLPADAPTPAPDANAASRQAFSDAITESRLHDMVVHGMAGVVVWSCGRVFGDDVSSPSVYGRSLQRGFAAIEPVADLLAGARMERSSVWILESQASVRAHWMLDSSADRKTWPKRWTSHENRNSSSQASRESWVRILQDLGYQPDFVAAPALESAGALSGASAPKLLVLPAALALSDTAIRAIEAFVASGGHVVADYAPARFDETLTRRRVPGLDRLFGIRRAEGPTAAPVVREGRVAAAHRGLHGVGIGERGIRGDAVFEEWPGLAHVQCEAKLARGSGSATYLNLAVAEYAAGRLDPKQLAKCRELRKRVHRVLFVAEVAPAVRVLGRPRPPFLESIVLQTRRGERVLAIRMHALANPQLFAELVDRGPQDVVLEFAEACGLRDLWTGRDLGVHDRFSCALDPVRPLLFVLRESDDDK